MFGSLDVWGSLDVGVFGCLEVRRSVQHARPAMGRRIICIPYFFSLLFYQLPCRDPFGGKDLDADAPS